MKQDASKKAIVIGAGISGLLVSQLLRGKGLDVTLLGPVDTRHQTLCTWRKKRELSPYAAHRIGSWDCWDFALEGQVIRQQATRYRYEAISGLSLKTELERELSSDSGIIRDESLVLSISAGAKSYEVETESKSIRADLVFDSRPPKFCAGTMVQQFYGIAVAGESSKGNEVPLLMEFKKDDRVGDALLFLYALPLGHDQFLAEATLFGNHPVSVSSLESIATEWAQENIQGYDENQAPLFNESGILPMGPVEPLSDATPIGIASGSARMSSGYSLTGLEKQIADCRQNVGLDRLSMNPYSRKSLWMDKLFLRVLSRDPGIGKLIFSSMGCELDGDTFARFMTDQFSLGDALRVVGAMPKKPFLRALFQL